MGQFLLNYWTEKSRTQNGRKLMMMLSSYWWKRLCGRELLSSRSHVCLCWNAREVNFCLGSVNRSEDVLRFYLKNKWVLLLKGCVKVQDSTVTVPNFHDTWYVVFFLNAPMPGFSLIWTSCLSFYEANKPRMEKSAPPTYREAKSKCDDACVPQGLRKKKTTNPRQIKKTKWILVYKSQWFLEHWLMMSECLGLPNAVNWNVTLVCLSAWAIYGKFPLDDKGRESRRCWSLKAIWIFHCLVSSQSFFKRYFIQVWSNDDFMFSNPDFLLWLT